jgi:rubrerythrin
MFFSTAIVAFVAALGLVSATPIVKRDAPTDTDILQYALTLEHLENAFYSGALEKFNAHAFAKAGFPSWVRERFEQIAKHEQEHVQFLSTALGSAATQPCTYKFPYTDPKTFAALSMVLEGVGVSAYLGAAQYIKTPAYLTAAGSILTTESRHAAWVGSAVNKGTAWSGAFDIPLDLDQVYSLAAEFITGCPSTNPTLPVKAFPSLVAGKASPGASVSLTYKSSGSAEYLAVYSGLTVTYAPISGGKATLPKGLTGTIYAVVTSSNSAVSDDNTVAGPAVFEFPDNE